MAKWNIDPKHANVSFSARHLMITTVRGHFETVSGTIDYDPANPAAASVEATIDAASINTGVADRDNHLRSADFLNAAAYPTLTFKSTKVELVNNTSGKVHGDLTIAGVTKPVTLNVDYLGSAKDPWGNEVISFEADTKINREDWGLTWNVALEAGGWLVGQEIKISLSVEAIAVKEPATA